MAYIVIQGSKGFVSLVEKGRVRQGDGSNPVCTKRGICGLGNMTKEEYIKFRDWAHSFDDQEERKAMVLLSGKAIETKETATKEVADDAQKKTTVKKSPQQRKEIKSKITILDKAKHQEILEKEKCVRLEDEKERNTVIESKKEYLKRDVQYDIKGGIYESISFLEGEIKEFEKQISHGKNIKINQKRIEDRKYRIKMLKE